LVYFNIKAIQSPQELVEFGAEVLVENEDTNSEVETLGEDIQMINNTTPQLSLSDELVKLHMTKRHYVDAVRFIHQIHTAIPTCF
jgi:hypothetical protein